MKTILNCIACMSLLVCVSSKALLPPKYLSVPHWQDCVITITKGKTKFVCLPESKPKECPRPSWRKLTLRNEVNSCSLK